MKTTHETSGPSLADSTDPARSRYWSAERILLVCLLSIGLLGLVMTYGSRLSVEVNNGAASAPAASGLHQSGDRGDRLTRQLIYRDRDSQRRVSPASYRDTIR